MIFLCWKEILFETFRAMNEARPFKLVFSLEVPEFSQETGRRLARALDSATAEGLLDFLNSPPTIRRARSPRGEWDISFPDFDSFHARALPPFQTLLSCIVGPPNTGSVSVQ